MVIRLAVPYLAACRVIETEAVGSGYNLIEDEGAGQPVLRSGCRSSLRHPGY